MGMLNYGQPNPGLARSVECCSVETSRYGDVLIAVTGIVLNTRKSIATFCIKASQNENPVSDG